ncbi:MAG TPA: hypothetical protein VMN37_05805 [Gemmatimonadales bacterium]|nr:hypothetical protein [Gemmatimonadales bacterium]
MSTEALGTYLNDHLAGSVAAVEMVDRAIEDNAGTPLASALAEMVAAIREDQEVLRGVLERLKVAESPLKQAGAWLAEKAGRLKLGDTSEEALHRLEMLEALSLGIQGKLALWRALQRVAARHPALAGLDLGALERRAREQHERVEAHRIEAAIQAL